MRDKELFSKVSLLYVEDEEEARLGMKLILGKKFKKLQIASDGLDGLNNYKEYMYDVVVTDIKMPNMNGIEMVKEIRAINPNVKVIYTSAHSDSTILMNAIEAGANEYILKPINKTSLIFAISKVAQDIIRDKQINRYGKFIRLILDSQDNIVVVTDGKKVVECNKATLQFMQKDDIAMCDSCICEHFIAEDGYLNKTNWIETLLQKEYTKVKMYDHNANQTKVYIAKITPFAFEDEDIEYVVTFTDITQIEEQREKLSIMATTDQLTQTSNRTKLKILLEKEIQKYKREKNIFSIIFFDIDYFKKINDTYGHNEGDSVLKELANVVNRNIRSSDTLARWGGEEFIILTPCTTKDDAIKLAEKLRVIIEDNIFSIPKSVTCSFGVSEYIENEDEDSIIKRADEALYRAKESGRNRVLS
jgi:diguanylate cyclase (GGDEF)-like protein